MAEPITETPAGDDHASSLTAEKEAGLSAEIAFWKEMLELCGDETPAESRERMGFALALAKKRLKSLFEENLPSGRMGGNPRNVFDLDKQRRRAQ